MAQTQSGSYWSGLRDDVTDLAIGVARARFIDSQTTSDEMNVPDRADIAYGESGRGTYQAAPGGVALSTWITLAAVVAVGVFVVKQAA